jgi:hypothetical protein
LVELRGDELDPGIIDEAISLPPARQNARIATGDVTAESGSAESAPKAR